MFSNQKSIIANIQRPNRHTAFADSSVSGRHSALCTLHSALNRHSALCTHRSALNRSFALCTLYLLLSVGCLQAQENKQTFQPTDPAITYVGRTLHDDQQQVSFDWVGVYFRFRFTGTSLAVRISDTKSNYYNVFLDGTLHKQVNFKGTDTVIDLCKGLEQGVHNVMVYKRTEGNEGKTTLHEILLDKGAVLLPALKESKPKIEFIGNSITCGFGTETNNRQERYTPETENSYHSYAAITARYFDADFTLTAHSGIGVVRNYGDKKSRSDYTMLHRFYNTFDNNKDIKWDFSKWQPDAVVINLGTNDFSQEIKPTKAEFVAGYKELVTSVRKAYGNVPVFCLTSPMSNDLQYNAVKEASESLGDPNVYFVPMLPHLLKGQNDLGASYHPSHMGQRKMAMLLIPYLSAVMNWELKNEE